MDSQQPSAISAVFGAIAIGLLVGLVVSGVVDATGRAECAELPEGSDGCWAGVVAVVYGGIAGGAAAAVSVAAIGAWRRLGAGFCVGATIGFLLLTALWSGFWFSR